MVLFSILKSKTYFSASRLITTETNQLLNKFLFDQKLFKRYDDSGIRKRYLSIGSNLSIFIFKPPPTDAINLEMKKRKQIYKRESNDLIQSRI
jgi:hypothetical protein